MKKILFVCVLAVVLCGCGLNAEFVRTCKATWDVIGPEYQAYIENDETLSEETKAIRLRTAIIYTEMLKEAEDAVE